MMTFGDRAVRVLAWGDRLIPAQLRGDPQGLGSDDLRQARLLNLAVALSLTVAVLMSFVHLMGGDGARAAFAIFLVIPISFAFVLFWWRKRTDVALHYLCALLTFAVLGSPFLTGDSSPLFVGLIAVPTLAALTGGAALGLTWTGLIALILAAAAAGLPMNESERSVAWTIMAISTGCGFAIVAATYSLQNAISVALSARESAGEAARVRAEAEQARDESRTLFATAFERAPSILLLTDVASGEILDVNRSFERSLGFSREEVLGQTLIGLKVWPSAADREHYVQAVDAQGHLHEAEVQLRTKAGDWLWVLVSAERLDIEGRSCMLSQGVDIRDRKQAEAQLELNRRELELRFEQRGEALLASQARLQENQRLAAVGTLAAGIAHQINNPIGGIVAAAEFALTAEDGDDRAREHEDALRTAVDEARRCGRIVKNVLKFARDEPTAKWVEDLGPIVRRSSELVRVYVEESGGRLEIETSKDELLAMVSPIDLEQVVVNLVRNAAESRTEGASVYVGIHPRDGMAEITIRDDGRGIDEETRSHLFEPFYTTRLEDGGSGLGLSVVHGVVGDHGGSLQVETSEGEGTCMRILLPTVAASTAIHEMRRSSR